MRILPLLKSRQWRVKVTVGVVTALTVLVCVLNINSLNQYTSRSLLQKETVQKETATKQNETKVVDPQEYDRKAVSRKAQAQAPVIVFLIHQHTNLDDLCLSMKTLVNIKPNTPMISFHLEDYPSLEDEAHLRSCSTGRSLYFAVVDLDDYPSGFTPLPNKDYSSAQINRFWTTGIWDHPALRPFDVVMRIDHDTCFSMPNAILPDFKNKFHNFHSQYFAGTVELNAARVGGMHALALEYMKEHKLIPGHTFLWQKVTNTFSAVESLPSFQDSFEVVRKEFMQRPDILEWHRLLTELPPYGYFTQGWNVDAERFLTMSIFGTTSSVDVDLVPGFVHKNLQRNIRNHKICTYPFE